MFEDLSGLDMISDLGVVSVCFEPWGCFTSSSVICMYLIPLIHVEVLTIPGVRVCGEYESDVPEYFLDLQTEEKRAGG
jgi:hypothetical protein